VSAASAADRISHRRGAITQRRRQSFRTTKRVIAVRPSMGGKPPARVLRPPYVRTAAAALAVADAAVKRVVIAEFRINDNASFPPQRADKIAA